MYFTNCIFHGNAASTSGIIVGGGGFANTPDVPRQGYAELRNCTFFSNHGPRGLSVLNGNPPSEGGLLKAYNCIFWDGEESFVSQDPGSSTDVVVSHCTSGNAIPFGTNILTSDPLLDGIGRPACNSPAVDSGVNAQVPADVLDVDGDTDIDETLPLDFEDNPRQVGTVDRGAFEHAAPDPCPADINNDQIVDIDDLLAVISAWGPCAAPPAACPADIAPTCNVNGVVDIDDLLTVISAWGLVCATGDFEDVGSLESVQDCMDKCSQTYTAYSPQWDTCVNRCVEALCEAQIIQCD